jgi:chemotaxis protein CheX
MNQLQEFIAKAICQCTEQVFSTMLGVEIGSGESSIEATTPEANDGVVALIGVAGPWTGTGSLSCSPHMACRVCSQMLMSESPSVDEEVLDAVAELTNMIVGGVKTELELQLGPLGISIPTVVFGKNFKTKSATHSEWVVVRFSWENEPLDVKLCLARNEKAAHFVSHAPAPTACAMDVGIS